MTYRQYRFYSAFHDCDMIRLSVWNGPSSEYYMFLPWSRGGAAFRQERASALEAMQEAIDAGVDPGELRFAAD